MPITMQCPFYVQDRDNRISCEAGHPRLPDRVAKRKYVRDYCAGDWKRCTLARAMLDFYDRAGSAGA